MRRAAIAVLPLLSLLPGAARAGADSDALLQFGLIGNWALHCQAPPSPTNPFVSFTPSSAGQPTRQIITGRPEYDSLVPIRDAAMIDNNHLRLSYPQGGVTVTVTLVKEQRRIRPFDAIASDGTESVKGGIVQYSGQPTSWLERCAD
ncbi:MAG TPA: hypothetical protein VGP48_05185 [Stellaceae bacterium]|jgi:hypothetical protein|nr:hypothetical protein [Stellaceae bacterium]